MTQPTEAKSQTAFARITEKSSVSLLLVITLIGATVSATFLMASLQSSIGVMKRDVEYMAKDMGSIATSLGKLTDESKLEIRELRVALNEDRQSLIQLRATLSEDRRILAEIRDRVSKIEDKD